jgi:bifunctional DNA-binding transcriptional regulator/antitoxin component of YhaV-PrlF toxin-antitoxin module
MESIKIISNVDDDGRLCIPKGLTLKKGKVELIIKPIDDNNRKMRAISYSDHYCGKILVESLRREDIYGDNGR